MIQFGIPKKRRNTSGNVERYPEKAVITMLPKVKTEETKKASGKFVMNNKALIALGLTRTGSERVALAYLEDGTILIGNVTGAGIDNKDSIRVAKEGSFRSSQNHDYLGKTFDQEITNDFELAKSDIENSFQLFTLTPIVEGGDEEEAPEEVSILENDPGMLQAEGLVAVNVEG